MAVIYQQPDRWSQLGAALGGGISAGLMQKLAQQMQQQQEQAQHQKEAQEMISLARALGVELPQGFDPRTQAGVDLMRGMIEERATPEAYTLSPGQTRYVGDKPVASVPAEEEKHKVEYYVNGRKRVKLVPESQFNETVTGLMNAGATFEPPQKAEKVTYSKILPDGRVLERKAVPGSKAAQQLEATGFMEGELEGTPTTPKAPEQMSPKDFLKEAEATNKRIAEIEAGVDILMPGEEEQKAQAIERLRIQRDIFLDAAAGRIPSEEVPNVMMQLYGINPPSAQLQPPQPPQPPQAPQAPAQSMAPAPAPAPVPAGGEPVPASQLGPPVRAPMPVPGGGRQVTQFGPPVREQVPAPLSPKDFQGLEPGVYTDEDTGITYEWNGSTVRIVR